MCMSYVGGAPGGREIGVLRESRDVGLRASCCGAESGLGTFKSILFSLPSSPAASPAALAAAGGLGGMAPKLATAGEAKSGHAGPAKTPEVASLALPARGAWGGMLYLKYGLVPCSSRAARVVSRCSGLVNEARLLESTLFM